MGDLRRQAAEGEITRGFSVRIQRTFTEADVAGFARLTRDYNPVHSDPRWCALKGFAGPICHGMLIGGMICEPGGQWGWLADGMSFRFLKPVYPGDTVTCDMTIRDLDARGHARAECVFTNQRGETVLTGELTGYLPDPEARALLATMLAEGDPGNPLSRNA
jgi:acyl dehydratase